MEQDSPVTRQPQDLLDEIADLELRLAAAKARLALPLPNSPAKLLHSNGKYLPPQLLPLPFN